MAELVSTTYSTALFEVCIEENKVDEFLDEMNFIKKVVQDNDDFFELLKTPKLNVHEKKQIIDNVFSNKLCKEVTNFLKILIDKRRMQYVVDIATEFEKKVYDYKGIVIAQAYTAMPLNSEQIKQLEVKLSAKTGKKVEVKNILDKNLLGGVMIKFNDVVIDGTVKGKLVDLENYLNRIIV